MDQQHYVGLDVSLETTSVCVIDQSGAVIWRGKCSTEAEPISQLVRRYAPAAVRVGLETGQMSNWLTLQLRKHGLPVVCVDARHAKAALSLQLNKTDANDAHGLAHFVGTNLRIRTGANTNRASVLDTVRFVISAKRPGDTLAGAG